MRIKRKGVLEYQDLKNKLRKSKQIDKKYLNKHKDSAKDVYASDTKECQWVNNNTRK